jgi:hypothetical protein
MCHRRGQPAGSGTAGFGARYLVEGLQRGGTEEPRRRGGDVGGGADTGRDRRLLRQSAAAEREAATSELDGGDQGGEQAKAGG